MPDESPRQKFYRLVSEAVADLDLHGFDSIERVRRWTERLEDAARAAAMPPSEVAARLRSRLDRDYLDTISPTRFARVHSGLSRWALERVRPELRAALDRRIVAAADLIVLDREASIRRTLQRFQGWATSIPAGGSKTNRREEAEAVRRGIAGLPFVERRVVIDQGHKLAASLDDIIARDGGAIAVMWRHVKPQPGYDPRPEHVARDGRVYLLRDSWAHESGLVKIGRYGFYDDIKDQAGQAVYCRCWAQYLYSLRRLPDDMLTARGRAWLKRGDEKQRA